MPSRFALLVLSCLFLLPAAAAPLPPEQVPDALKPWIGWALWGHQELACPSLSDNQEEHHCVLPTQLELDLDEHGGRFGLSVRVYAENWTPLPGDAGHWPQDVAADGKPALLGSLEDDQPGLRLAPGLHRISGRFAWDQLPESLGIPKTAGIIRLTVQGKPVPIPAFNDQGALWIHHALAAGAAPEIADTLTLKVFRHIADGVPVRVTTRIDLDISGRSREALLQGALLEGAIPLSVSSDLPARLEPDGRLRLQARPGHWTIDVEARLPGEVAALKLPENPAPWPREEIWAFKADPEARLVEVEGVPTVDPRQTGLPGYWKDLPAYRLEPGTTMALKQVRRGDPEPEPDSLTLRRRLWLDFDGGGYTAQDHIFGRMTHDWRLNVLPGTALGRVSIGNLKSSVDAAIEHGDTEAMENLRMYLESGLPQSITQDEATGGIGVEIRQGNLDLAADSRMEGRHQLPATGWDQDFRRLSVELNLPPGWRLLATTGVDEAPGSWASTWTLLDLFVVLIVALAAARLWGWPWGTFALLALVLLWQEAGAPRYVWLHLLAATALLRALPAGRFAIAVQGYRALAALALAFVALPFMADQVRFGLYPQLQQVQAPPSALEDEPEEEEEMRAAKQKAEAKRGLEEALDLKLDRVFRRGALTDRPLITEPPAAPAKPNLQRLDPSAITQTGPGLPTWQWTRINLAWNGPVLRSQEIGLALLPPAANLLLNLARVALLLGLAWLLVAGKPDFRRFRPGGAAPLLLIPLLLFLPDAKADYPSPELLETLRARLMEPPDRSAEIPLLRLETGPAELRQTLEIHALAQTLVPLPAQLGHWLPSRVEVDGQPAEALLRSEQGLLWLALEPGRHTVKLAGPLPAREQVQIPLPSKAHRVETAGTDWEIQGIGDNGVPDDLLQLIRKERDSRPESLEALEPRPLAPFLEVRRTLRLGLDWQVDTQVTRVSPPDGPVALDIPLLPGESVLTAGLRVKNGKVAISLLSEQSSMGWQSALEKRPDITLEAPATQSWTEVWQADTSPIWHLRAEGLVVVHHQNPNGLWLPEWRPWPGESVSLHITRPQGVPGNTLTIDSSDLRYTLGQRASDASLDLKLRSSQGGRHELRLPEGAALQSVLVDGKSQPIRQQGRAVSLPIHPGEQAIVLNWRSDSGISTYWRAPEVDLGAPSVNASTHVSLSYDRRILLLGGPKLGPAVLFWGVLALIPALAAGLGRAPLSPLKAWQWGLLLLGLSQIPLTGGLVVAGWLFALAWREQAGSRLGHYSFNALQIGLPLLTLLALRALLEAVQQGLLWLPPMQVAGYGAQMQGLANGSYAYGLNWYQDRAGPVPPQPWIVSTPLWTYRALMLMWALWLAYSLLDWLRWGFRAYVADGLWRIKPKAEKPADPPMVEQEER